MFFRKKKSKLVVTERTPDYKEFEIPEIAEKKEKRSYQKDHFVSPIFGTNVKDKVVIPNPVKRTGDLDKQLDDFRTEPKLSNETKKERYGSEYHEFDLVQGNSLNEVMEEKRRKRDQKQENEATEEFISGVVEEIPVYKEEPKRAVKSNINDYFNPGTKKPEPKPEVKVEAPKAMNKFNKEYRFPSFNLLNKPVRKVQSNEQWVQKQIDILDRTFEEFKVGARVKTHTKGPTVTRYEIELESGVYVKKVTGITDNIKMALAAKEIRIEAPIPGKSTVGIEVPNEVPEIVHFYDIVSKDEFKNSTDPLTIALGLDIDGLGVYSSISKMPHGLVAGATGSGKSVCINTILMSLLFKYSPDDLKLMLIDPKMVELSAYNDLPHLITPVITDAKIATAGLKWAVEEMEKRFVLFSNERVRDIKSYNEKALKEELERMPYIVIIVDELADLMMVASSSVEEAIMRLTQKARACGIHLIIATQRPSTDVVKGTIKSNIPTRIAFMVSSYIDSMTIIDGAGADKLLGRGDMLYAESGKPQRRVQGAFISDTEISNVNEFIRRQRDSEYMFTQEKLVRQATSVVNSDDLFEEVARFVIISKACSINKISKQFNIGFNRAQKIVETLHEQGIVSENVGSKARTVLVTIEELDQIIEGK
ncbi:DNA translocase SftA [Candidatus Izimaplasma bacterium HR1]|jgi:S-DNA-T family DNA segregation ATPase FtsK/SpoIIIE|uniref:DNA translocase FtsK n=1 Tax=Candidatus Izimoplasma sp. HR1 TaxID=1541959 RepID=UPI0004F6B6F7|nr:DNA translocase SftA [Candidatus Izimaplasma bacterium HR1]